MTLHKLYRKARHHTAGKRSVTRDQAIVAEIARREPTPEEAVALTDELDDLLRRLDPESRRVLEMRLRGHDPAEIADDIGKSKRTVRRMLAAIWEDIARHGDFRLPADEDAPADANESPIQSQRAVVDAQVDALAVDHFRRFGELSLSRFRLESLIGSGASGKVYRSTDLETGGTVAVKFLMKEVQRRPEIVRRFIEEAGIVRRLAHPGIVGISGIGRTPIGGFFLVQEWIDGPNLSRFAVDRSTEWGLAARWITDAAEAIEFAHSEGVIHCDLKPANLLLAPDGRVRVTDFGLATRAFADAMRDRGIAGTVGYLAPEQVEPDLGAITPRTDLFGLGATLFALLTGQPPIVGDSIPEILSHLIAGNPLPSVATLRPDLPAAAVAIVDRCLAKRADDRFQSARELYDVLCASC